jgi:tripartite-type tricarboxylate transporter receptor subunit TctC
MTSSRRDVLLFAVSSAALSAFPDAGRAQDYPSRPITLVVPYAAGGSADTLPRIIAERMRATLGKPVVIDNATGAAGSIGTGRVARAAPDGYTFGLGNWSTHVANGAVYPLQYDVRDDFEPIAQVVLSPLMIATSKKAPPNNLKELVAWLKANPNMISQGTNGPGSIMHLAGVLLQKQIGTNLNFVPYRGAGPAMQDLLSGQIDLYVGLPADILPQARAGNIKVHAVAAKDRIGTAPEVPTVDEVGLSGFHVSAWCGFWAPKATPRAVIARLSAATREALADPAVRQRLQQELNLEIPAPEMQTPEALRAFQAAEIEKWWPIIRAAKITAE